MVRVSAVALVVLVAACTAFTATPDANDTTPPPNAPADASTAEGSTLPGDDGGSSTPDASPDGDDVMVPVVAGAVTFWIDRDEVTNEEADAFRAAPPTPASIFSAVTSFCGGKNFDPVARGTDGQDCRNLGPKHPVVCVDWCFAYAFCRSKGKRLCGRVGGGASSESNLTDKNLDEWTAACAGPNAARRFSWGGDTFEGTSCNTSSPTTEPIRTRKTCIGGAPGVYDMTGNVWEWTDNCSAFDCWVRGGSFGHSGEDARCNGDVAIGRGDKYNDTGFRCCSDTAP